MRLKFVGKLMLFGLPVLILGVIHFYVAATIGEIMPFYTVAALQAKNPSLVYEPAWQRDDLIHFKFQQVLYHQPQVIVIGSSRTLYFRDAFLNRQPETFYNVSIFSLEPLETYQFLEGLAARNALPPIILMSMDLPYFNANESALRVNRVNQIVPQHFSYYPYFQAASHRVAVLWLNSPYQLLGYLKIDNRLGLVALENDTGYRPDGSYYDAHLLESIAIAKKNHADFFRERTRMYELGDTVRHETLDAVENVLKLAEDKGVTVIGFLPPYQSSIWQEMTTSGDFDYIAKTIPQIELLFRDYKMPFYDFSDASNLNANDDEFIDTWHIGEKSSLRLYLRILQDHPNLLAPYSDVAYLEDQLAQMDNPFFWFVR
jgi:hypothetical protein